MLKDNPDFHIFITTALAHFKVVEMNDGGMGSLKFLSVRNINAKMQEEIASIDLYDIDSIPLFISLNTNTDNEIYELDVFKADFSPLKKFPVPPYTL